MTTSNPVVPRIDTLIGSVSRACKIAGKQHSGRVNFWRLADTVTIALAVLVAERILAAISSDGSLIRPLFAWTGPLAVGMLCTLLFSSLGVYSHASTPLNIHETEQILRGISSAALTAGLLCLYIDYRLEATVCGSTAAALALLMLQRSTSRKILKRRLRRERILLYIAQPDRDVLRDLSDTKSAYGEIAGLLYKNESDLEALNDLDCGNASEWKELPTVAKRSNASRLVVVGTEFPEECSSIWQTCESLQLRCSFLLDPRVRTAQLQYEYLDDLPVATIGCRAAFVPWLDWQRALDLLLGSIIFIVSLPFSAVISALIRWDSPGPVLFRQERIGENGQPFELWKFRTMHADAPKYQRSPVSDSDPRLTKCGRILRRLSLDELPQLVNVLKGDMSLVGPRPEMPFIVDQYGEVERQRLLVRPGITGLWQISRARSMPIHQRLQYDLFYIEHRSIFLDVAILLRTATAVIKGVGAT